MPSASENAWLESISRPRKILLVEDEQLVREVFLALLGQYHCVVTQADDGQRGVESFDRDKPDVVILDLRLPGGLDGFDVFAYIRAKDKSLPVIIITGELDGYVIDRIYAHGYAIFARKPGDINAAFLEAVLRPLFLQKAPVSTQTPWLSPPSKLAT